MMNPAVRLKNIQNRRCHAVVVTIMPNIFQSGVPQKGETFDVLLEHKNIKIERIVSSDKISDFEMGRLNDLLEHFPRAKEEIIFLTS